MFIQLIHLLSYFKYRQKSLNLPSTYIVATPKHIFTLYFLLIISKKIKYIYIYTQQGWHFQVF